ncbi:MAG: TlpA disulfide reductase family protein [Bacteroidales bacterium]|jgi:thiol-disulfide isomerase/thioredoxin
MKIRNILIIFFAFTCIYSCTNKNTIELQLTEKNGYGPFKSSFSGIFPYSEEENNPWTKTFLKASGTPENWINVKKGDIETNLYQSIYQNYFLGNISKEWYEFLQQSWGWNPDTLNLSKTPMKSKIAFAFGTDSLGITKMVVDANNNLDFSDDIIFTPFEIKPDVKINDDSLAKNNAIMVTYERFSSNKIIQTKAPLLIIHMSSNNMFLYNFPQYASTQLDGEEIALCSDNFNNLSYNSTSVVLVNDSLNGENKANYENIILKNEYIKVKEKIYKNIGVNHNKDVLTLEKTSLSQNQLYSTQVGYKSFSFAGQDFKTKSSISLDNFKGKYILLDFWAVWCGPCLNELPNLKNLYDKIDKNKFEIIGIVGESSSDVLERMIKTFSITWPQILSDDTNKIKETYGIISYPTTFLISPEGIIVAKNLRNKELEDKIIELINKQ